MQKAAVVGLAVGLCVAAAQQLAADFTDDFFFGLAIAPGQSEDQLNDTWVTWAEEGNVAAWHNQIDPQDRLWFYSNPELTLDAVDRTKVQVLRLGIDWTRLAPEKPHNISNAVQNWEAMQRYKEIVRKAKARGYSIMMTLFHHSAPAWFLDAGGWKDEKSIQYFADFAEVTFGELINEGIDYWITFNEPTIFAIFTYCARIYPPGPPHPSILVSVFCITPPRGAFFEAIDHIGKAHNEFVGRARTKFGEQGKNAKFGIAHNLGVHSPAAWYDYPSAKLFPSLVDFPIMDAIIENIDFLGINYYGREIHNGSSVSIVGSEEYSESGRVVDPNGLLEILRRFHKRYNVDKHGRKPESPVLPFIITENGVADATDLIRPSYIIEHLLAVDQARKESIPVKGYIHWTILDNWEWSDGYCPKFGLAGIDRATKTVQYRETSMNLMKELATTKVVTEQIRADSWNNLQKAREAGVKRPFCRAEDGSTPFDDPVMREISPKDWRFNSTLAAVA